MTSMVRVAMAGLFALCGIARTPLAGQSSLAVTASAPSTVSLTWIAAPNANRYWVQRAVGPATLANLSTPKITDTKYDDTGAPTGVTLSYRVMAGINGSSHHSYSKIVTITVAAAGASTALVPVQATPLAVALAPVSLSPVSPAAAAPPPGLPTVVELAPVASVATRQPAPEGKQLRAPDRVLEPAPGTRPPPTALLAPAPQNLRVQSQGPLSHLLAWDALPGVSGYTVAYSGKTQGDFLPVTPQPISSASFSYPTLVNPGATFRVTAIYADGRQGSADLVYANPPPAEAPTGFSARRTGLSQVTLSWRPVAYAKGYRIFGSGQPQDGALVSNTAATLSNLGEGSYSWQVTADYGGAYATGGLPTATLNIPKVIVGFADTHTHPFANLAAGGRLFWGEAFGPLPAVLSICEPWHGFGGLSDFLGNIRRTMNGNISVGHHTGGFPNFDGWPAWNTLDHQQMYSDWIYRAYQGGLRLLVSHAVNNGLVCSIVAKAPNRTCDDMEAADLQIEAAKSMQFYTDMQSGGVGKGWFRIAYTPQEARNIIADGKLAVVLGIEVDKLFGCGKDECDAAKVDEQLDKYYARGVRHLYPLHFADNAYGGYALGGESERTLFQINSMAANKGGIWSFAPPTAENCSPDFAQPCNQRGLTALGAHLITSMMNRGMIIDIDHMGKRTTDSVLVLAAARHYPIMAGHTGFVETALPGESSERDKSLPWLSAMKQDGGMVSVGLTPGESKQYVPSWRGLILNDCPKTSKTWIQGYLYAVDKMGGPDSAAIGVASDQFLNELLGPRFDNHCAAQMGLVMYPLVTRTGVTLQPSQAGTRTFDYNTEGLAHYGLLPDFIQDLKNEGLTDRDLNPLFRSAEGYIELWERAVATIPAP